MSRASDALGSSGEEAARRYAESRGYRTVARNVRTPFGEIDLVLEDRAGTLIFVEVKTRAGTGFGDGAEAVTRRKRERVRSAGLACARALGRRDPAMRFDVFSIASGGPGKPPEVDHIEDAF